MRIDGDQVRGAIGLISGSIDMKSTLARIFHRVAGERCFAARLVAAG